MNKHKLILNYSKNTILCLLKIHPNIHKLNRLLCNLLGMWIENYDELSKNDLKLFSLTIIILRYWIKFKLSNKNTTNDEKELCQALKYDQKNIYRVHNKRDLFIESKFMTKSWSKIYCDNFVNIHKEPILITALIPEDDFGIDIYKYNKYIKNKYKTSIPYLCVTRPGYEVEKEILYFFINKNIVSVNPIGKNKEVIESINLKNKLCSNQSLFQRKNEKRL